jgi:ADP-heptose:LPS heptosyltransferase
MHHSVGSASDVQGHIVERRDELRRLNAEGTLTVAWTTQVCSEAAELFMRGHRQGSLILEAVDILMDVAALPDFSLAEPGTKAFFANIIEKLADTFQRSDRLAQEAALARAIMRVRRLRGSEQCDAQLKEFDVQLTDFGLNTEDALIQRVRHERKPKSFDMALAEHVKMVIMFSRVSLGADVALTGVAIQKALRIFPNAAIVIFGSKQLEQIFGGHPRIRIKELKYERRGGMIGRFLAWPTAVRAVRDEAAAIGDVDGWLIINLSARVSQTGLLPFMPRDQEAQRHFFWDTTVLTPDKAPSLVDHLNSWLQATFGAEPGAPLIQPALYLRRPDEEFGAAVAKLFGFAERTFVVSMKLGVGGLQDKRVWDDTAGEETCSVFEREVVLRLLARGDTVVLDKGFGAKEDAQAKALALVASNAGYAVVTFSHTVGLVTPELAQAARLILLECTVGELASVMHHARCYVGYDSQGQHVSAALGLDVVTVFAGYPLPIFPDRWRPSGSGRIKIIRACSGPFYADRQQALAHEVLMAVQSLSGPSDTAGGDMVVRQDVASCSSFTDLDGNRHVNSGH